MAEVVLDVKVNTGASTNALKEARNEIKQLTAAALEAEKAGDKALSDTYAKKAAEARDQVKDLQEIIGALITLLSVGWMTIDKVKVKK